MLQLFSPSINTYCLNCNLLHLNNYHNVDNESTWGWIPASHLFPGWFLGNGFQIGIQASSKIHSVPGNDHILTLEFHSIPRDFPWATIFWRLKSILDAPGFSRCIGFFPRLNSTSENFVRFFIFYFKIINCIKGHPCIVDTLFLFQTQARGIENKDWK